MTRWLTIVGMGEDGVDGLPLAAREAIDAAETVLGPERLLASLAPSSGATRHLLPQGEKERADYSTLESNSGPGDVARDTGSPATTASPSPLAGEGARRAGEGESLSPSKGTDQRLIPWQPPLPAMLEQVMACRGRPTAIVATGDPMWFGIAATLTRHLAPDEFRVLPHVSSFQLAAARLGWPLQNVVTLSLHGRAVVTLAPHILPGNRILALTGGAATVDGVAAHLVGRGYGGSPLTVLENLGSADERTSRTSAADGFEPGVVGEFHVLAIDCVADAGAPLLPPIPGLPDEAYRHDGQLTKRDVRAATLARLAPFPGALLWDIGAGCGSVAIEWMRAAPGARAIAFERDPARLAMVTENAIALGAPGLETVAGEAPGSFTGGPSPDAVFLGGSVSDEALFEAAWAALKPHGRLVANAVTLDGEAALLHRQGRLGGELVRIDISVLDSVGGHAVMRPRLPVTQYAVVKL